jgi:peptidoglycan-associated lipoprotein
MKRRAVALLGAMMLASGVTATTAQRPRVPPPPMTIAMLQMEFVGRTGSDLVYFTGSSHGLDAAAQRTLIAQARWLLANPAIRARIEGHADERTPRDYALAVGERRATAVRDFLVLQGVPAAQLTIISWGKERPVVAGSSEGALALNRRAKTVLMR